MSQRVNTFFVERHNGSDRHRNSRKVRKTYRFSKDWEVHRAVTYFTMLSANFCCPVRTLRVEVGQEALSAANAGHGGRADRSYLVNLRVVM